MRNDTIEDIVDLCITINQRAMKIYRMLLNAEKNDELKQFWTEMASEEKSHEEFWKVAKELAQAKKLHHVFDDPLVIKEELTQILDKVKTLSKLWNTKQSMENALILAYRLEYDMLHPAFELLYHTLKPLIEKFDSENIYDKHINRFIQMFVKFGNMTPAMELLGETLENLWKRNKTLTRLVMTDSLTGLLTRRGFFVLAKEIAYLAQRKRENMGLLMIDIDEFKTINDTYGHPKGDEVLKGVADSLKSSVRKSDIVGRFGGEEFIILFPTIQPNALHRIAETIREGVESLQTADIPVTISIGVYQGMMGDDPDEEIFSWIAKADECLYQAKTNGRNCIVFST